MKNRIRLSRHSFYEKDHLFINYTKRNRLAHEILLDSKYIQALRDAGVPIKYI